MAVLVALAATAAACSSNGAQDAVRADMEEAGLSEESIECMLDAFDGANIDFAGLDGATVPPDAVTSECVGRAFEDMFAGALDEAFADLSSGDWETPPGDFPSHDDMDELAEACRNGDNAACDNLWLVSPFDSPEEALAESCGGRSPTPRMGSCELWLD